MLETGTGELACRCCWLNTVFGKHASMRAMPALFVSQTMRHRPSNTLIECVGFASVAQLEKEACLSNGSAHHDGWRSYFMTDKAWQAASMSYKVEKPKWHQHLH